CLAARHSFRLALSRTIRRRNSVSASYPDATYRPEYSHGTLHRKLLQFRQAAPVAGHSDSSDRIRGNPRCWSCLVIRGERRTNPARALWGCVHRVLSAARHLVGWAAACCDDWTV